MVPRINVWVVVLFCFAVRPTEVWPSALQELIPYVEKYSFTSVSQEQQDRLQSYEGLIYYFTSFGFFAPNRLVSADFIKALILAESAANPNAISPKGAIGLGQIILSTGQEAARELYLTETDFSYVPRERLKSLQREDLFDPATNILLTCYLIAKYNLIFEGKIELVLSAWNAGVNTNSLSRGEHAPYQETRNLIGKVNGYYVYFLKQKGGLRK